MTAITILLGISCLVAIGGLGLLFVAHEERIVRRLMLDLSCSSTDEHDMQPPLNLKNADLKKKTSDESACI